MDRCPPLFAICLDTAFLDTEISDQKWIIYKENSSPCNCSNSSSCCCCYFTPTAVSLVIAHQIKSPCKLHHSWEERGRERKRISFPSSNQSFIHYAIVFCAGRRRQFHWMNEWNTSVPAYELWLNGRRRKDTHNTRQTHTHTHTHIHFRLKERERKKNSGRE